MKIRPKIWNSFGGRSFVILLLCVFFLLLGGCQTSAEPASQASGAGQDLFESNCMSCHTIGAGALVGPDLEGVLERRDREWLAEFIRVPDQIILSGDPIAMEMLAEFNNVEMPNLGLSESDVEALLVFLESSGDIELVAEAPLPPGDIYRGEAIFAGGNALEKGGTPCIACHSVDNIGFLSGGVLGPDLTKVYTRYGEAGLAAAIKNIAFPTMRDVYVEKDLSDQEVADLLAYFADVDTGGKEDTASGASTIFWGVGLLGAAALFGFMLLFWSQQKESLSDRLRKDAGITSRRHS
ncbi:MAG: cytochrome c [Chloroflexi bacterium]|nr:cytochrome c [Chloroflexota bacterium]